jgi:hypothetical protein
MIAAKKVRAADSIAVIIGWRRCWKAGVLTSREGWRDGRKEGREWLSRVERKKCELGGEI